MMLTSHAVDKIRPNGKSRQLRIRVQPDEDTAIREAARLSGTTVSAWARTVLREGAERRLQNAGVPVPWIEGGELKR